MLVSGVIADGKRIVDWLGVRTTPTGEEEGRAFNASVRTCMWQGKLFGDFSFVSSVLLFNSCLLTTYEMFLCRLSREIIQ